MQVKTAGGVHVETAMEVRRRRCTCGTQVEMVNGLLFLSLGNSDDDRSGHGGGGFGDPYISSSDDPSLKLEMERRK